MTVVAVLLVEGLPEFSQDPSNAVSVSEITYVPTTALHLPLCSPSLVCPSCSIYLSHTLSLSPSLSLTH